MNFIRTRLAPSPTGALHLGHARTFLITWWLARNCGAQVIMRMEDLDAARRKAESIQQAYGDLRWLGMDWDSAGSHTSFVQSERMDFYADVLRQLQASGAIFPCVCTRKDIAENVAASVGAPHESEVSPRYPGTCRRFLGRSLEEVAREVGRPACWRLKVDSGAVAFDDAIMGPQSFDVAADAGDFPLTRFDAAPAYQLAVVTDDHAMDIDCVIRGDDLLSSTPRQLLVYRALGWSPPRFAHVTLVVGPDGKRLAKRHGESRVAQFREAGVRPERIVGWVAWRSGQIPSPVEMSAAEMIGRFDLAKLPRQRIVLGPEDFAWLRPS